jgi:hypothetical protein
MYQWNATAAPRMPPPRVQRAPGHHRFDDFLTDQREEERHADFVDEKSE